MYVIYVMYVMYVGPPDINNIHHSTAPIHTVRCVKIA